MVISQTNGFNWHWKCSIALFEQLHHFSCEFAAEIDLKNSPWLYVRIAYMEDFKVRNIVF